MPSPGAIADLTKVEHGLDDSIRCQQFRSNLPAIQVIGDDTNGQRKTTFRRDDLATTAKGR